MQFPFLSAVVSLLSLAMLATGVSAQPKTDKAKEPISSETLTFGGKTLQEWIAEIPSPDRSKGENAIRTVLLFGPDRAYEALPAISKLLNTHSFASPLDVSIRVNSAIALGIIVGSANKPDESHVTGVVTLLHRLLSDKEAIVRYRAAEALGRIGPAASPTIDKLIELAVDPTTWEVRQAVATALGLIAVEEKGKAPDPKVQSALFKRLFDPAARVRLAAIQSLTYLGAPADERVKGNLVKALMDVATKDTDPSIRIWAHMAVMGCTAINDEQIVEITKVLGNKDMNARLQAAQAIGTIGGPKAKVAVPALIKMLEDPEDSVVLHAIWGLSRMGLWGEPAVPTLQKLVADPEELEIIKRSAAAAIAEIKGTSTPTKKN